MRKAYSYIRFSSKKQAAGDSFLRQKDMALAYVAKHGLELDTTLNFSDLGVSAFTGANVKDGALGMFIKAISTGLVPAGSVLLIEDMDRLSRAAVSDALPVFTGILNAGVDIVTLKDGNIFTRDSLNDIGKFFTSVIPMFRANAESVNKSDRVKAALDRKRADKLRPVVFYNGPIWLTSKPDMTGWDLVEPLAETVRWVFDTYLSGIGVKTIAKMGNAEGRAFGKKNLFNHAQVWRMLRNPATMGTWELGARVDGKMELTGEIRENYYPAVVSAETFYRAQAKLNANTLTPGSKTATYRNLLQGIIRCGHCGSVMTRRSSNKAGKPDVGSYVCGSRAAGKHKCPTIAAHRLEPVLLPTLYTFSPAELQLSEQLSDLDNLIKTNTAEQTTLTAKLASLEKSVMNILDAGEPIPDLILSLMNKNEAGIAELQKAMVSHMDTKSKMGNGAYASKFSMSELLALIVSDSPEAVGLRYAEHLKLIAQYKYVFVWAEDVGAAVFHSEDTAWFKLSSRHKDYTSMVDNKRMVIHSSNPELAGILVPHDQPDWRSPWYLDRPLIPDGFNLTGINHCPMGHIEIKFPEPKAVRNTAIIRPAIPVRKRPVNVKAVA